MTESHAITTLFNNINSAGYSDFHSYVTNVQQGAIPKQKTVAAQVKEFMRYIAAADEQIKREHQNHLNKERQQHEKSKAQASRSSPLDRRSAGSKRDHTDVNYVNESSDNYFSISDLLAAEIPKEKIDQLQKSAKTNPTTTPSSNTSSNPSSNPNPTPYQPYHNPTRGGRTQRGGRAAGRTSGSGRGGFKFIPGPPSIIQNPGGSGHFNADTNYFEDDDIYVIFDDDDEFPPCSCLYTCHHIQHRKRDHNDNFTSNNKHITQLHHDDGNSGHHIINSMKNLLSIKPAGSSIVKSMSGIDPTWKSSNEFSGYHPLLGEVVFNPRSRVSLINPNILINDGWKLCNFSGTHGDIVKLYSRQFDDNTYFIEFIMNINGQLIANDPADDPHFVAPPPTSRPSMLGSLQNLREYLLDNHADMMDEYRTQRDTFFANAIDESQNYHVSFEGVNDNDQREDADNIRDQFYTSSSSSSSSSSNKVGRQRKSSSSQSEASNPHEPVQDHP